MKKEIKRVSEKRVSVKRVSVKRVSGKVADPGRRPLISYSRQGKNMEGISGSAARTITLKPAFAKAVPLTQVVQECFVRGANLRDRVKRRAASVKPANFSVNSGLKGSTSVSKPRNLRFLNKKSRHPKNLSFL